MRYKPYPRHFEDSRTSEEDGLIHITYSISDPDISADEKKAIESAIGQWNALKSSTGVVFDPAPAGRSGDLEFTPSTDTDLTGGCAGYDPGTKRVNYSPEWEQRANSSFDRGATVIAHEIGHVLGLDDAGTNPPNPTIMNNPVAGPTTTCQNATVPTTTVQAGDGKAAGACIKKARPTPTPTPAPTPDLDEACGPAYDPDVMLRSPGKQYCCFSPVLIDVAGDGFDLTDAGGGVDFDLNVDGRAGRVAWTAEGSDDAWLALDRNGNGRVDDGAELFGNYTPQPPSQAPNGFIALAEFDEQPNGGNHDGVVDGRDAVFSSLRLWRDDNHDGASQPAELHALHELGLASISLDYKEVRRRDRHGNSFRYQAAVTGTVNRVTRRLAYDVFLVSGR
jgi:hypothetical protein